MTRQIRFTIHGTPVPQGSKQSYVPLDKKGNPYRRKNGGVAVQTVDSNKRTKPWMAAVSAAAAEAFGGELIRGPVRLTCWFYFKRPKNHFSTRKKDFGRMEPDAPEHYCKKPDLDKLIRAICDGLTGTVWHDDSQVCGLGNETGKFWTVSGECAEILIEELEG